MSISPQPAPILLSPTWSFDGDDGAWSTFAVSVGTPPQSFRLLPSTASSETWVPSPEGCQGVLSGIADCGTLRGVNDINGTASSGFLTNASSTWSTNGIYELATEENLFGSGDNALYGLDTVTLQPSAPGASGQNVSSQTVVGMASENYWLGCVGLGTDKGNFSVQSNNIPSLMASLGNAKLLPGLSFGYSAAASYANDYGSLVLGGYDSARHDIVNLTVPLGGVKNETLAVSLESIVGESVLGGTRSLATEGSLAMTIDSTISELWLPQSVCDNFEQAFGLTYDNDTGMYLVNSTMHSQLLSMNPTTTFTIGQNGGTNALTTNIVSPYSAFNLNASIPLYNTSTPYFPLKVAANESQYVLGRAFLQEAYIFVDWDRQNPTIAQAMHQNSSTNIVPVLSQSAESAESGSGSSKSSLGTGDVAGSAVGSGLGVIIAAVLAAVLIFRRRRKQRTLAAQKEAELEEDEKRPKAAELHGQHVPGAEIMSEQVYEMSEEQKRNEAMHTPITELPGHTAGYELEDTTAEQEKKAKLEKRQSLHELE